MKYHPVQTGQDLRDADRGCRGKVQHASKKQAAGVVRLMRQQGRDRRNRLSEYKCATCGKWHIGRRYRGRGEDVDGD